MRFQLLETRVILRNSFIYLAAASAAHPLLYATDDLSMGISELSCGQQSAVGGMILLLNMILYFCVETAISLIMFNGFCM